MWIGCRHLVARGGNLSHVNFRSKERVMSWPWEWYCTGHAGSQHSLLIRWCYIWSYTAISCLPARSQRLICTTHNTPPHTHQLQPLTVAPNRPKQESDRHKLHLVLTLRMYGAGPPLWFRCKLILKCLVKYVATWQLTLCILYSDVYCEGLLCVCVCVCVYQYMYECMYICSIYVLCMYLCIYVLFI